MRASIGVWSDHTNDPTFAFQKIIYKRKICAVERVEDLMNLAICWKWLPSGFRFFKDLYPALFKISAKDWSQASQTLSRPHPVHLPLAGAIHTAYFGSPEHCSQGYVRWSRARCAWKSSFHQATSLNHNPVNPPVALITSFQLKASYLFSRDVQMSRFTILNLTM